ncbi:hypothetical protein BD324DRAFT_678928 [Kockovaella imperatae]|uniref:Cytidyltransferase-like domain-containing protein n=1 Tax=Kockovaella imperatae TaxID=4999 RepID=A0A1Y1UP81_9TREE|nr:hypothetical protein BD324DRAFT_678928 [Kockovaella imperatae]ORX39841.1 hypothetical protein BD324DRAFT_678928 [Kockovaella imperatae]
MDDLSPGKDRTVLLLPFTPAILNQPDVLLPIIHDVLTRTLSKHFTVIFSTPYLPFDLETASSFTIDSHQQLFNVLKLNPDANFGVFQAFLGKVYSALVAAQWSCERVSMDVEVLFEGELGDLMLDVENTQVVKLQDFDYLPVHAHLPTNAVILKTSMDLPNGVPSLHPPAASSHQTVALGGTFDHLHAAHKLLLQLATFLSSTRLIVGVMADSKLSSKSNADLIQPIDERITVIETFLSRLGLVRKADPDRVQKEGHRVIMDVVEIEDPFGPTAWDRDIQILLVSQETVSGGKMVNDLRKGKQLPELKVYIVDVISSEHHAGRRDLSKVEDEAVLKELKMGSTGIRQWIKDHPEM